LPVMAKVFERLIHSQLYKYMSSNNLFAVSQSGFRKGHSTETSMLRLSEELHDPLSNHKMAFDTVNHCMLLKKLNLYGIRNTAHAWFREYLSDRHQFALINGTPSELGEIVTGVPQGSILGPLLFVIYINDLPTCLHKSSVNMYADDTTIYYSSLKLEHLNSVLQKDLLNVYSWLNSNKLSLNLLKTSSILICGKRKRSSLQSDNLPLAIDSVKIGQVQTCDYLGVTIDQDLTFKRNLDKTIKVYIIH